MPYGENIAQCGCCGHQWKVGDCIPSVCPECEKKGHNGGGLCGCAACVKDHNQRDADIAKAIGRDPEPLSLLQKKLDKESTSKMTPEQKAAYIFAQAVAALAEIEGMRALNQQRHSRGEAIAYDDNAFFEVDAKYCIGHNAVIDFFRD